MRGTFNPEARALFQASIKGINVMTPEILAYGVSGGFVYELSYGTGIKREPLFGVTILERQTGYHRRDLSKCLSSEDEAMQYIRSLGRP
jgi:hypothetical protein